VSKLPAKANPLAEQPANRQNLQLLSADADHRGIRANALPKAERPAKRGVLLLAD